MLLLGPQAPCPEGERAAREDLEARLAVAEAACAHANAQRADAEKARREVESQVSLNSPHISQHAECLGGLLVMRQHNLQLHGMRPMA